MEPSTDRPPLENGTPGLTLAWMLLEDASVGPSPASLPAAVAAALAMALRRAAEGRKEAVRAMVRHGKYKPSGRGKPACEYLLAAAEEGAFPAISNLVDAANLASLESQLPISLVDLDRAAATVLSLRRGRPGESYVFNPAGQMLDLQDLLLLSAMPGDAPCATPVKDSQATKVQADTRRVLAVVYAPDALADAAGEAARRMAEFAGAFGGGHPSWGVLPSPTGHSTGGGRPVLDAHPARH